MNKVTTIFTNEISPSGSRAISNSHLGAFNILAIVIEILFNYFYSYIESFSILINITYSHEWILMWRSIWLFKRNIYAFWIMLIIFYCFSRLFYRWTCISISLDWFNLRFRQCSSSWRKKFCHDFFLFLNLWDQATPILLIFIHRLNNRADDAFKKAAYKKVRYYMFGLVEPPSAQLRLLVNLLKVFCALTLIMGIFRLPASSLDASCLLYFLSALVYILSWREVSYYYCIVNQVLNLAMIGNLLQEVSSI